MKTLITTFLSLIMLNSFAVDCNEPAKSLSCDYYRTCVESRFQCGINGYPLGYGEKYCLKFLSLSKNELSPKGLKWRDSTLKCLQTLLSLSIHNGEVKNCKEIHTEAFDSHPGCYTLPSNNLCDLPLADWKIIASTPSAVDLFSIQSAKQIATVLGTCSQGLVSEYKNIQTYKSLPLKGYNIDEATREREIIEKLDFIDELQNNLRE